MGATANGGIYLGALDAPDTHRLTPADSAGVYLSSGWLLWVRGATLVAQRLDLERNSLTGDLQSVVLRHDSNGHYVAIVTERLPHD